MSEKKGIGRIIREISCALCGTPIQVVVSEDAKAGDKLTVKCPQCGYDTTVVTGDNTEELKPIRVE